MTWMVLKNESSWQIHACMYEIALNSHNPSLIIKIHANDQVSSMNTILKHIIFKNWKVNAHLEASNTLVLVQSWWIQAMSSSSPSNMHFLYLQLSSLSL